MFISIVMPVHNREHTIGRAIESILNQTHASFELIIVDDASTDGTRNVVRFYDDKRIRYIAHAEKLGAPAARNTGIREAQAEWIAFHDSDDIWMPDKLEKQINRVLQNGLEHAVYYTGFYRFKHGKREYIPEPDLRRKEGDIHRELLVKNFVSTQTVLLPKACLDAVGGFDEEMPRLQDWELWIRLSERYPFCLVDEPLVHVFYSDNSISASQENLIRAYRLILQKHGHLFREAGRSYFASLLFSYGHNLCLHGDMRLGRTTLYQSLRSQIGLKSIAALIVSFFGKRLYRYLHLKWVR
jgi:glycosyltransferase involved in cell wall biosynthesis